MLSFRKISLSIVVLLLSLASLTACSDTLSISPGDSGSTPTADVTGKPFKIGVDGKFPPELAALSRVITANNKVKSYKLTSMSKGTTTLTLTVIRPDRVAVEPTGKGQFDFKRVAIGDTLYTYDQTTQRWLKDTNNETARQLVKSLAQSASTEAYANATLTVLPDEDFEGQKVGVFQIEGEATSVGLDNKTNTIPYKGVTRYDKNTLLFRQVSNTVNQNETSTSRFYDQDSPTNVVEPPI